MIMAGPGETLRYIWQALNLCANPMVVRFGDVCAALRFLKIKFCGMMTYATATRARPPATPSHHALPEQRKPSQYCWELMHHNGTCMIQALRLCVENADALSACCLQRALPKIKFCGMEVTLAATRACHNYLIAPPKSCRATSCAAARCPPLPSGDL
jgi:hypothetical protein